MNLRPLIEKQYRNLLQKCNKFLSTVHKYFDNIFEDF
jgi:hypothetical protein